MAERWTHKLRGKCTLGSHYTGFLGDIEPLAIEPDEIRGKVLVIGQALAFPEKTLVCTAESDYRKLRPEVETLYCCDPSYPSSPELHLEEECINLAYCDKFPEPKSDTAFYKIASCYYFLPKTPFKFFDTVIMFRHVDTGVKIRNRGLVWLVAEHLANNGHFICTGGRFPEVLTDDDFLPLKLIRQARLCDYSDGYPFTNNNGVVLRK